MPRPPAPNMLKKWKITLDAALAGAVEHRLLDPVHRKPIYGARSKLIEELLSEWLEKQRQLESTTEMPSSPVTASQEV